LDAGAFSGHAPDPERDARKTSALLQEDCTIVITIHLSTEDLTKVRLVPSPLWETVISFRVLLHHDRHTVHAPWATRARPKLNLAM